MRVTWRGLELPTRVERDTKVLSDKYGRFYVEPFERGFGTTIGNSLRRVLLSTLEGSAVTNINRAICIQCVHFRLPFLHLIAYLPSTALPVTCARPI